MASDSTIARPYAKAAFEVAQESDQFAQWSDFLSRAEQVVAAPLFEPMLNDPRISDTQLIEIIKSLCSENLLAACDNFLHLLASYHRLAILPAIACQFAGLLAQHERYAQIQVSSATTLAPAYREQLEQSLTKRLALAVQVSYDEDAALLGGAVIRTGDLVIDGSIRGKLERLKNELES